MGTFISRLERLPEVASTQDVVRGWLAAGEAEVCVCVADVQTRGRGRLDRSWLAPPGAGLLVSAGFRPAWLPPRLGWRLAAIASLAMIDAAEEAAGLREGSLALKWPNDLVAPDSGGEPHKVAGVLGESVVEGSRMVAVVVGIGLNADWPAGAFPAQLAGTMTSLREVAAGRPVDRERVLAAWLDRLEPRYEALRDGRFDAGGWTARQVTTGRHLEVETGLGVLRGTADGVDPESGALLLRTDGGGTVVAVASGEVVRCRLA